MTKQKHAGSSSTSQSTIAYSTATPRYPPSYVRVGQSRVPPPTYLKPSRGHERKHGAKPSASNNVRPHHAQSASLSRVPASRMEALHARRGGQAPLVKNVTDVLRRLGFVRCPEKGGGVGGGTGGVERSGGGGAYSFLVSWAPQVVHVVENGSRGARRGGERGFVVGVYCTITHDVQQYCRSSPPPKAHGQEGGGMCGAFFGSMLLCATDYNVSCCSLRSWRCYTERNY